MSTATTRHPVTGRPTVQPCRKAVCDCPDPFDGRHSSTMGTLLSPESPTRYADDECEHGAKGDEPCDDCNARYHGDRA